MGKYQYRDKMHRGINDLYETYLEMSDAPVDKKQYKEIIETFNEAVVNHLVAGGEFNMGNRLSSLYIIRAKVNPKTARIDWKTSMELRADLIKKDIALYDKETGEGEKWFVYHTTKQYVKFHWEKQNCRVKNSRVYRFDPTGGDTGAKGKLKNLIKKDDLAYLRFRRHGNL